MNDFNLNLRNPRNLRTKLWIVVVLALAAGQPGVGAQPQGAHAALAAPEPLPETVADDQDFPFLTRIFGTALLETTRIAEPLEVKPAAADSEAMLAATSFVQKSYTAPSNVGDAAFIALYRDAFVLRGWRILDEPPATAAQSEPHVISLSAHYAVGTRDVYARISRAPEGSYQISVADVGAEDWSAMLDRTCHLPVFSLHFSHEMSMSYQESRPSLEKLAALLRASPDLRIEVQGHVDNAGTEKELITLSTGRAAIVNAALIGLGIARERVAAKGYGKSKPIAPNDTDWGRTKNRRIEISKNGCVAPPKSASVLSASLWPTSPRTSPRPAA